MVISPSSHESSAITPGQCPNPTVSALDLSVSYTNPTEPNVVSVIDLTAYYTSPTKPNVSPLSSMPLPIGFTANPTLVPTASSPLSSMPLPTEFTTNPAPIPTTSAPNLLANPIPNTSPNTPSLSDNITSTNIPIPSISSAYLCMRLRSGRTMSNPSNPERTMSSIEPQSSSEPRQTLEDITRSIHDLLTQNHLAAVLACLDARLATIEASQKGVNHNDTPPLGHDSHDNFDRGPVEGKIVIMIIGILGNRKIE
ncbi:hypothetical protein FCV25MIE_14963 [Fagus crenata]